MRLETFDDPHVKALIDTTAKYLLQFKYRTTPPCWLTLLGKSGNGKTHAATAAYNHIARRSDWSEMDYISGPVYWPAFVNLLRDPDSGAFAKLNEMARWPVLMLDDIAAERDKSGFASEQLNTLLGQRVRKWTIITANLSLEGVAKIEPRIADRIIREEGNLYTEVNTISYGLR